MELTSLDEAFAWLESFTNLEKNAKDLKRQYRPERMQTLLEQFGNPQNSFKSIHLAGSKGKGSTSVMLASCLDEAGVSCGLYTSPHVLHYRERIQVNGRPLGDELYINGIKKIREGLSHNLPGGKEPTTFELLTLLAFLLFEEMNCTWAVIETGLGGRLDATNTLKPEAVVLTPVELEHTQWLGNTIEAIAREKAGIIKPRTPVFLSPQKDEALSVFRDCAQNNEAPLYYLKDIVDAIDSKESSSGSDFRIRYAAGQVFKGRLRMLGAVQCWNAALALETLKLLFPDIPVPVWQAGLAKAYLPARMEVVETDPLQIVDGSHTLQSVSGALDSFLRLSEGGERTLLFACQEDKDAEGIASIAADKFENVIITTPGYFKSSKPETVYNAFRKINSSARLIKDIPEAYGNALEKGTSLLVLGSFYLAGEIYKLRGKTNERS